MNYYEIIESLVTDSDFLFTMAGCGTAPEMTPSDTKPAKNPVDDSLENLQNILKSSGKVGYGEAIYEKCRLPAGHGERNNVFSAYWGRRAFVRNAWRAVSIHLWSVI